MASLESLLQENIYRCMSMNLCLGIIQEDLVNLVKNAKSKGRRIVMVSLGTVVTSDRAKFGWKGTGAGERYVYLCCIILTSCQYLNSFSLFIAASLGKNSCNP